MVETTRDMVHSKAAACAVDLHFDAADEERFPVISHSYGSSLTRVAESRNSTSLVRPFHRTWG